MRWKVYPEYLHGDGMNPTVGQLRINGGFLWTRKTIGDERRWLESAEWYEQYQEHFEWIDRTYGNGGGALRRVGDWVPVRWY